MDGWNTTENSQTIFTVQHERNDIQIAIAGVFLCLILILALCGNILVIGGVCFFHNLREDKSNKFILNLALTDLLNASIVMLSALVSLLNDSWPFGKFICDLVCAANYCFIIVSMLTLCFISIDRYQAVIHPLHYHQRITSKLICMMIAYTWTQGVLFAIVPAAFNWVDFDYWEVICAIEWHSDPRALYYVIAAFTICFLIPSIILVGCYYFMLAAARKCRVGCINPRQNRPNTQSVRVPRNTSSKTIRSLIFVVVAYFICLTPFCVTKLIKVLFPQPDFVPGFINLTASWFGYMSSAVNPMIYGFFRRDFRAVYIRIFKRLRILSRNTMTQETIALPSVDTVIHVPQPETSSLSIS